MNLPSLQPEGFAIVPHVVGDDVIVDLIACIDKRIAAASDRHALRNLHDLAPIRELTASDTIRSLIEPILGQGARMVRGIFFDKTPDANWKVAWHQDLSIAVREKRDVPGFGPWSKKQGVTHVQPPRDILENLLTLRLHLDDCSEENGPLKVIPGSHVGGTLTAAEIERTVRASPQRLCTVPRGGAVLMRPLILHASSPATQPRHRRVIHLEFAAAALPGGLQWHVA